MKKEATLIICITLYSVFALCGGETAGLPVNNCGCSSQGNEAIIFKNVNGNCSHRCNDYGNKLSYSADNLMVFIERGHGAFYHDDDYGILVGHCIFCNVLDLKTTMTGEMVMIQQDGQMLSECLDNAEGFFCSQCKNGYHLNLGRRCEKCDNLARDWTLFILAEFVPIFLLLVVLLLMNWSLVGGAVMATVFFAQMVTTTMDIDGEGLIPIANLTSHAYSIEAVYHFFYQPFNLNFFYPFVNDLCLIRNSSYLWYFVIQYAVAAWPLILCAAIGVLMYALQHAYDHDRIPNWAKKIPLFKVESSIAESFGNILASSILLSYNKFILISAYILAPNPLLDQYGNVVKWVSFYDPNLEYLKPDHLGFFVVSAIILLFLVVLPIPLIVLRYEVDNEERHYRYQALRKVVLHPFQRHYRNDCDCCTQHECACLSFKLHDYRWVPALYLALRLFFILTFVLGSIGYKFIIQYIIQVLTCLLVLVFVLVTKPYAYKRENDQEKDQWQWHYVSDAPILIALITTNLFNMYQFYQTYNDENLSLPIFIVQITVILLPAVVWIVCILAFLVHKGITCCKNGCYAGYDAI